MCRACSSAAIPNILASFLSATGYCSSETNHSIPLRNATGTPPCVKTIHLLWQHQASSVYLMITLNIIYKAGYSY
ncbi:hypothetical protein EJ05DRAFT_4802 [Pseudovirgaria hyperparasitica]|uniref:Uncharacterized protein n=1 Tax=Pseudovirgaria hyperparasitica TaxID=470096 RepID=A0A6A6WJR9_9PEZI|nr:uncharacterized protein EJ05DRAFT_4802 [Pseudovirgaria hyperparasitica]KAF2762526.1 hypothetical protein EJ05DRAFT_4802 [Pseudovirgaria hyperparasitica]